MVPIYGIVIAPFYLLLLLIYLLLRNNNNPTLVDKWFKTVIINENEKTYISKTVTYIFLIIVILLVALLSLFVIDYVLQWKKEEAYRTQINTEMKSNNIDTTIKNPDEIFSIPINPTATTYLEIYNECTKSPEIF